ncbi:MAG: cell division protein ZapA [Flavobacteriales bacterium]|nr:cell division protein ZapA [Flavobacteriales bacterium]
MNDHDELSIRVEIAGRAYPLTVARHEEPLVQRTAQEINESIARLRSNYPLTDKLDLLAMAALEVASRANIGAERRTDTELLAALEELSALLPSTAGS